MRFELSLLLAAAAAPVAQSQRAGGWSSVRNPARYNFCDLVAMTFRGQVSFPGQPAYNASQSSYYVLNERNLSPGCVFVPKDTNDVSQFIRVVEAANNHGRYGAWGWDHNAEPVQFAVRSGGHSFIEGAANIQGGVTVDMRQIKAVSLSQDRQIGSIGGGAAFSDVYPQLDPYNVTVQGGRLPGIAAGGFVSGGGKTFSGRKWGWSCDNVYGYEIVLASGEVAYATATSYPDLWLALKGGSSNFGLITRYDMKAFPQGQMWGGVLSFNYTDTVKQSLANAFQQYMAPANYDEDSDVGLILGFIQGAFFVQTSLWYLEPTPYPKTFVNFTSNPSITDKTVETAHVSKLVTTFGKDLPSIAPLVIEDVYSFKNADTATYMQMIADYERLVNVIKDYDGLEVQFLLQPQPVTNGTNAMGLEANQQDVVMGLLSIAYNKAEDTAMVRKTVDGMLDAHKKLLTEKGLWLPFIYLNYADSEQDVFGSWGQGRKQWLQGVAKKYDPKGVFQKNMPGGIKLF